MSPATPHTSVVLCTYNRAESLPRVIHAVLAQEGCEFELLVVDDGSTDATPQLLASVNDERLRVVRRRNGGVGAARNTGLEHARARWIVFLDDDDLPHDGWLETLSQGTDDPSIGITLCGVTIVDPDGNALRQLTPAWSGRLSLAAVRLSLAGGFAVRRDLVCRAGGYLDGLGSQHQYELFIRLLSVVQSEALDMVGDDACVLRVEARKTTDRKQRDPRLHYDATRWILVRHPQVMADRGTDLASFEGIAGTAAARLEDWSAARRHHLRAARAAPTSAIRWGRLALASMPAIGRMVWNRHGSFAAYGVNGIGVRRQGPKDERTGESELFLPWRYRENPPHVDEERRDTTMVQRLGTRLARKHGWTSVRDVSGCHGSTADLGQRSPSLTICINVMERTADPVGLLHDLARVSAGRPVLLSTADRAASDPERPLGPPSNPRCRRVWTRDEFELLLLSTGFTIDRTWFLPRRWYWAERPIQHALRRRPMDNLDATMVFLVRATTP